MYIKMGGDKLFCQSLHSYPINGNNTKFVNIGNIENSTHVFECGIITDGVSEINSYINADGTCSFINSNATTFTSLSDVPHNYKDKANHVVVVSEDENNLKFSDILKISSIEADVLKIKILQADQLISKEQVADYLKVNNLVVSNDSQMDKVNINNLNATLLNGNTGNITGNFHVEGDFVTKSIECKGLFNSGKSILDEVTGTVFQMDVLECEVSAQINSLEIGNNLSVYGNILAKEINSNVLINTGNFVSDDIKAISGSFSNLKVESIEIKSNKSELVFGTLEYPEIISGSINFELKGLRCHGYGYSPTQANDTIILKIKTHHKLENSDIKIGFKYYNTKDTTPTVFKIGEVLYPILDGVTAIIKLSNPLPIAPYWVITVDINPF